jgi:hypothetical protein
MTASSSKGIVLEINSEEPLFPFGLTNQRKPIFFSARRIYVWDTREGSGVFARLMIRAITAAISSMIAVPATKTVTKAMSKAVLA